jgi:hypothetical protein
MDGLQYLIRRRTDTLFEHLSEREPTVDAPVGDYGFEVPPELPPIRLPKSSQIGENDEFGLVNARMLFTPVHPLTLSMAISISIVRQDEPENNFGERLLTSYLTGIRIPIEMNLIQSDGHANDQELSRILDLDDVYTQAFLTLGEALLVINQKLVPPPPLALSNNMEGNRIPTPSERADWLNSVPASHLDILCGAWLAANPIFQLNIEYGWRRSTWLCKDLNSVVHNAIEHFDFLLDQANQELNRLLEENSGDAILKQALLKQRNAARLVNRARRFYEWDADEIWGNEAANIASGVVPPELKLPPNVAAKLGFLRSRREADD